MDNEDEEWKYPRKLLPHGVEDLESNLGGFKENNVK